MNQESVKMLCDTRNPGVTPPSGEVDRPMASATVRSDNNSSATVGRRSRLLKKIATGTVVSLVAALSLFGCQSAQEEANATEAAAAKAKASNTTTQSNWPKMVTIPSGTTLQVSLDSPLSTDGSKVGDNFSAHLTDAVRVDQMTVLPSGTEVRGRLTVVEPPHRTTGKAQMTLVFDQVMDPAGQPHSLSTAPIVLVAEGDKISDEEKVAAGAVIGGIIGAVSSDQQRAKGAAVGAAAGAAAGGVFALATKGHQIELPVGQRFAVGLNESLKVSVTQVTANR